MKKFIIYSIGWLISALILIPCLLATIFSTVDYHYKFHMWYHKKFIEKPMFPGAKPMVGKDLQILKQTSKRLISNKPTHL